MLGAKRKIFALAMYISFLCVDFIRIGSRFSVEYGLQYNVLEDLDVLRSTEIKKNKKSQKSPPWTPMGWVVLICNMNLYI